jgi:DNA-binding PadR family transcriptional regulator
MTVREFDPQRLARSLYELLVLAILRDGAKHGYQIGLECAERSGGAFVLQHGTLYPVLHRLEQAGHVEGAWSEEEGERRRKTYRITAAGRSHLAAETLWCREIFDRFSEVTGDDGRAALRATS